MKILFILSNFSLRLGGLARGTISGHILSRYSAGLWQNVTG
jgi:hypothetical protein